jgi:D-alanyl-D-alanine dipeptidase
LPKAEPPAPPANARKPDLADLVKVVPGVKLEVRYASDDNFLGTKVTTTRSRACSGQRRRLWRACRRR